ncbi:hypothetical protein AVEN_17447-1 [Araneus ventricosus]|uniref:Uncharacterized protein n=1 Tax=Araneus ventricosus TaxID=182803 RepID=A0A4Y2T1W8_ARAVE|nr:hypothetical protein AVEN_17447-1 [Araneus ventricosus]
MPLRRRDSPAFASSTSSSARRSGPASPVMGSTALKFCDRHADSAESRPLGNLQASAISSQESFVEVDAGIHLMDFQRLSS